MTRLTQFAIRHNPSGMYLPPGHGHSGRGGTLQEICKPEERFPRLFTSKKTAKRCLQAWLRGIYEGEREDGYSYWGSIKKTPHRKPEEMEIVELTFAFP